MKVKGLRKSKNIQDVRGPTAAYAKPSALKTARDSRSNEKFFDNKYSTASKSKMAKDAGLHGVDKAAEKLSKKKLPTSSGNVYKGKR
jgi:hypothetical protein